MKPYFLETKRLGLKPVSMDDFEAIAALRADPEVMRYLGDGTTWPKEKVRDWIQAAEGYFEKYGLDFFSVFEKSTGAFIGQAGLFHLQFKTEQTLIELAYRFHQSAWGKGYATEAPQALIAYGFEELNLPKIVVMHHPDNLASKCVIEKLGFHYIKDKKHQGMIIPYYELTSPHQDENP